MKITIYELLGLIKDGKAPKEIKYQNNFYAYKEYLYEDIFTGDSLFDDRVDIFEVLNDKIEITEEEEEKKIPEKLEQIMSKRGKYNSIDELAEEVFKAFETIDNLIINQNQLIDYLKSKGE